MIDRRRRRLWIGSPPWFERTNDVADGIVMRPLATLRIESPAYK